MPAALVDSIFLYSKYSDACKNVSDRVSALAEVRQMRFLCVDNHLVRKSVMQSAVRIENVPCILNFYQDGTVEKYEGRDVSEMIGEILESEGQEFNPVNSSPIETIIRAPITQSREPKSTPRSNVQPQVRKELQRKKSSMKAHKRPLQKEFVPPIEIRSKIENINIDELDSDSEPDSDEENFRASSGSKALVFEKADLVIPDRPDDPTSKMPAGVKQTSLMAEALKMQKMREEEESSSRKNLSSQ